MKWKQLAKAFKIFSRYSTEADYLLCPGGKLLAGPDVNEMFPEDVLALEKLGWYPAREGGFQYWL